MDARQTIRSFVAKELKRRYGADHAFADDESLILSKKTDSLFFIDLIVFLESEFSLSLNAKEITQDELDSVNKMVAMIEAR